MIYCLECRGEKLSDSSHFGWDGGNTTRRNKKWFHVTDVHESHFLFYGCLLLSRFTSTAQCERLVVTVMGVLLAGHGHNLCSWNYVNPYSDREIIQRISLQLRWWVVINWYLLMDKLIDILHLSFHIVIALHAFTIAKTCNYRLYVWHLWNLYYNAKNVFII